MRGPREGALELRSAGCLEVGREMWGWVGGAGTSVWCYRGGRARAERPWNLLSSEQCAPVQVPYCGGPAWKLLFRKIPVAQCGKWIGEAENFPGEADAGGHMRMQGWR